MKNVPSDIPKIYLKPGESHFSDIPSIVSTVLGSCVSITMHNQAHRLSSICHAVLPEEFIPGEPFRYVDSSIAAMLRQFDRYGIRRTDIEVKLFGGADILLPGVNRSREMTIGMQNILRAKQIIEREGLLLIASDIRGNRGRKLHFHTHTGAVYLQRLRDNTR